MKKMLVLIPFLVIFACLLVGSAYSDDPVGKAVIELTAGKKGDVTFPHEKHQKTLKDCNACHTLFPQQEGVIPKMIDEGKLAKKQVMNQCLACHRAKKKEGVATGPTSCTKCHKK